MSQASTLSSRALKPLTHGRVFAVAVPAFFSGITEPLLSLADVVVMGQLSTEGLQGGVAAAGEIFIFTIWMLGFLRLSTGGYAAQAFGEQNDRKLFSILWRGLLIALAGGVLLALIAPPLMTGLNSLMGWQDDLRPVMDEYLSIRFLSAPAVLFSYVCFGWLIGQQRTGLVLVLQAFINLSNIILTAWMVLWLDMGVAGAAWGSVIASYAGLVLGMIILWRLGLMGETSRRSLEDLRDRSAWLRLFSTNLNFFVRSGIFAVSFLVFFKAADWLDQSQGLDSVNADAVAVLWQYLGLIVFGLDAFAVAAEAFAGEAVGSGKRSRLKRACAMVQFWSLVTATFCAVLAATLGYWALPFITKLPDVIALASNLMPWIIASGFFMAAAFMYDGIYLGATRAGDMRTSVFLGLIAQLATMAIFVPLWGIHGLWLSIAAFMITRAVYLHLRYPALEASVPLDNSADTKPKA